MSLRIGFIQAAVAFVLAKFGQAIATRANDLHVRKRWC